MSEALLTAGQARKNNRYEGISRVGIVVDRRTGKTGPQVRLQYPDRGVVSAWTPVAQRNTVGSKDYNLPEKGERVLVQHLANGPERGVVVGCIYTESVSARPQENENIREVEFRDGTVVEYDPEQKRMRIAAAGSLAMTLVGDVTIQAPNLTITVPNIRIIGDVNMDGTFTLDGIVLNTHKHEQVMPGAGTSGGPVN